MLAMVAIMAWSGSARADYRKDCDDKVDSEIAVKACGELIRRDPKDVAAYYNRAMAYYNSEDIERAIADYTKVIELDPQHADAYNHRGLAYQHSGAIDRAIIDYGKAIEIDPGHADAYENRGNAYAVKGDYDRAIADHTKAIELDPEDSAYVRSLGIARYGNADFSGAAVDLLRAVELEDDVYAMLFRYLARTRAGEAATAELEANVGRLKNKGWPYAVTELYLGKRSPEATLGAASKDDEDRCEAHFYVGQWHVLRGKLAEARKEFEIAANTCTKTFIEYEVALAELRRLKP
jgi:lipoprotein NlpI